MPETDIRYASVFAQASLLDDEIRELMLDPCVVTFVKVQVRLRKIEQMIEDRFPELHDTSAAFVAKEMRKC